MNKENNDIENIDELYEWDYIDPDFDKEIKFEDIEPGMAFFVYHADIKQINKYFKVNNTKFMLNGRENNAQYLKLLLLEGKTWFVSVFLDHTKFSEGSKIFKSKLIKQILDKEIN